MNYKDFIENENALTPNDKRDLVGLSPITKEPKTGHWVLDGSDNSLECINCGCVIYANDIMRGEPHYCPNCGSRMSEVSE